ncbi:hypothetical protein AB6D00_19435 [Vibrio cyclitrophicus]
MSIENKNISIYILSSPLHIFQASILSNGYSDNIFIIDENIRSVYKENSVLKGRFIYTPFEDSLVKTIFGSFKYKFLNSKSHSKVRVFIGNQNHSICSIVVNKYRNCEINLLDDGLVNYGLQSEPSNSYVFLIKWVVFYCLYFFGVKIFSYGHGHNLAFPSFISVKFHSLIPEFKVKNRKNIECFYLKDKLKKSDSEINGKIYFLSYEDSISPSCDVGISDVNIKKVYHPRVKPRVKPELPYEFSLDSYEVHSQLSSIILVKLGIYDQRDSLVVYYKDSDIKKIRFLEEVFGEIDKVKV